MRMNILLFLIVLITSFNAIELHAQAIKETEQDYLTALDSKDIDKRISALIKINQALQHGELKISDNLKQKCYEMTREVNSKDFKGDDEGLFLGEVMELATQINDDNVLPFLISCINSPIVQKAISKRGGNALDALCKIDSRNTRFEFRSVVNIFTEMIKEKKDGYVARGAERKRIKEHIIETLNQAKYPTSKEMGDHKRYLLQMHNVSAQIKEPILDFFAVLGDKDVIPIVEDLANNDEGYEEVPKDALEYRKMTHEERKKHVGEMNETIKRKKAQIQNPEYKEETVQYYPVREHAAKILEELKKKNRM